MRWYVSGMHACAGMSVVCMHVLVCQWYACMCWYVSGIHACAGMAMGMSVGMHALVCQWACMCDLCACIYLFVCVLRYLIFGVVHYNRGVSSLSETFLVSGYLLTISRYLCLSTYNSEVTNT